jgi:hypothetical protein
MEVLELTIAESAKLEKLWSDAGRECRIWILKQTSYPDQGPFAPLPLDHDSIPSLRAILPSRINYLISDIVEPYFKAETLQAQSVDAILAMQEPLMELFSAEVEETVRFVLRRMKHYVDESYESYLRTEVRNSLLDTWERLLQTHSRRERIRKFGKPNGDQFEAIGIDCDKETQSSSQTTPTAWLQHQLTALGISKYRLYEHNGPHWKTVDKYLEGATGKIEIWQSICEALSSISKNEVKITDIPNLSAFLNSPRNSR